MLTSQFMATVWFLCIRLAYIYADVIYRKAENFILSATPEEILSERAAVSARHCSQVCGAECTAANYNSATSQCQLLAPSALQLTAHSGSTAHFTLPQDLADGQVGMWPLNELYGGKNLVPGKTDIQLHDISFNDVTSDWMSRPVRFAAKSTLTSYGQLTNVADVYASGSFAFIASIYREETLDFPLLEFQTDAEILLHIWVVQNAFYVSFVFDACTRVRQHYSSAMDNHQWRTLALSYDISTGALRMWVDGQLEEYQKSPCSSFILVPQWAYVNLRPHDLSQLNGHISCMGLYEKAMSYQDMLDSTTPYC